ncbi:MAG TPA: hypothetical protein VHD95_14255 [Rhizomicrobium sp.]|nr:hypothetical protein [Rhizomicrobium sp.]
MSELSTIHARMTKHRWTLLATTSTFAILALTCAVHARSRTERTDGPTVWVELGGQLERIDGRLDPFAPPFTQISPQPEPYMPISPLVAQRPVNFSFGGEGKISFEPTASDWVFSAAIRYGRSNNTRHVHQQSAAITQVPFPLHTLAPTLFPTATITKTGQQFSDTRAKNSESHAILDFRAGKDVGLGILGREASSVVSAGVRIAMFSSQSHASLDARPADSFIFAPVFGFLLPRYVAHSDFSATADNHRNFHGIGPSISWDSSAPFAGNSDAAEISFDWGVNAAVLFGRQKAIGTEKTRGRYYDGHSTQTVPPYGVVTLYNRADSHSRSRAVTVPNVGFFVGLSYKYSAAKLSLGYRGDFFFGAMDGGTDTRETYDRDFYGPFATISIGL